MYRKTPSLNRMSIHESKLKYLQNFSDTGSKQLPSFTILPTSTTSFTINNMDIQNYSILNIPFHFKESDFTTPEIIHYFPSPTEIDITTTGLNAIIDNQSLSAGIYLLWAFLDDNADFLGYGLSKFAFIDYSAVSGSLDKGTTRNITTTGNAFYFYEGQRVVLIDYVTNTELYYNRGTINSIANSTTLNITLDNDPNYGVNMPNSTGQIRQEYFNGRPNVVTTSTNDVYAPHYELIGWINYIDDPSDIIACNPINNGLWPTFPPANMDYTPTIGVKNIVQYDYYGDFNVDYWITTIGVASTTTSSGNRMDFWDRIQMSVYTSVNTFGNIQRHFYPLNYDSLIFRANGDITLVRLMVEAVKLYLP